MGKKEEAQKGTIWELPHGEVEAAKRRLFEQLGPAGGKVVRALNGNFPFFSRVVVQMIDLVTKPVHCTRAEEIMRGHYLGTAVVSNCFGKKGDIWKDLSDYLGSVPFSEETLLRCRQTHLLVAVFPLSIYDIAPPGTEFRVAPSIVREPASNTAHWLLIQKGVVSGSLGLQTSEQEKLLSEDDVVPDACDIFFADAVWRWVSGKNLFQTSINIRAARRGSARLVCIPNFLTGHLSDVQEIDDHGMPSVGLASCKKPLSA